MADVRRDALSLLARLKVHAELSVALIGDEEMHVLNREHRGKDRPTDVLSFEMNEPSEPGAPPLLGDVVISVDTAIRQARERDVSLAEEVRFLLAHGILHLLGYDHERSPAEARRMFAMQRRILRAVENNEE